MLTRLRQELDSGKVAIGVHCATTDITFYEMSGVLGYDYIWIDNEHTSLSGPMITNAIIAAQAGGCAAFVRVPANDPNIVKPIIDLGVDGIIFPMINTVEEAELAVASCTYPPRGIRGYGPQRATRYRTMPKDQYLSEVDKNLLKIIQIEHIQAVKNLKEILSVEGISAVICGAMDLSASIGKIGEINDPEMIALMDEIAIQCKNANVPFGISNDGNPQFVESWIKRGASLLTIGSPVSHFSAGSKQLISNYRGRSVEQ